MYYTGRRQVALIGASHYSTTQQRSHYCCDIVLLRVWLLRQDELSDVVGDQPVQILEI